MTADLVHAGERQMFIESTDTNSVPQLKAGQTRGAITDVGRGRIAFEGPAGMHAAGEVVHLIGLKWHTGEEMDRGALRGRMGWIVTDNGKWRVIHEASSVTLPDDRSYYVVQPA